MKTEIVISYILIKIILSPIIIAWNETVSLTSIVHVPVWKFIFANLKQGYFEDLFLQNSFSFQALYKQNSSIAHCQAKPVDIIVKCKTVRLNGNSIHVPSSSEIRTETLLALNATRIWQFWYQHVSIVVLLDHHLVLLSWNQLQIR